MPLPFGRLSNARTEYITFDAVDMIYPYNAVFRRGLLNTFEAALHSLQQSSGLSRSTAAKNMQETKSRASLQATEM
jgi:hypothetical protein